MDIYHKERSSSSFSEKHNTESPPSHVNTDGGKCEKEKMSNESIEGGCIQNCPSETKCEKEHTLEDLYRYILMISSILGIHLTHRSQDGTFVICRWAVMSLVVMNLICLLSIPPIILLMYRSVHFWYKVLLLPYIYGFFFCTYVYFRVVWHRYNVMNFLEAAADLKVPRQGRCRVVMWSVLYPLVISSCSMALFLGWHQMAFTPSLLVASFVPAVMDVYMGGLAKLLQLAFVRLTEKVETHEAWTLEDARRVMGEWFYLTELLSLYNKMFSGRVHMRLVGLLVQSLSYLFILWALERYGGTCAELVLVTLLPLWEVLARFYTFCHWGQSVICAGEDLLAAVREAAYEVGLGTPPHEVLSELATRLEASPPAIRTWGMESLSARTYVTMSGVMMTYVVVLLQFCERSTYTSSKHYYDPSTFYDHCFIPSNVTLS